MISHSLTATARASEVPSVVELFCARAAAQPHTVAVRFLNRNVTYHELDRRSSGVALKLLRNGVTAGAVVGLCVQRSIELVVGLLAVLKARGACLPLDDAYPPVRLQFMLANSGARVLVSGCSHVPSWADGTDLKMLHINDAQDTGEEEAAKAVRNADLAYVLYTSGSTGVPKGVAMEHGPLSRLVHWHLAQERGLESLTTAQLAPVGFDVSFQEIFSTLCGGGTLVLATDEERHDPVRLLQFIEREGICQLFLPTALLHPLAAIARHTSQASLRDVYVAGEQLKITDAVRDWMSAAPACRLHNHYGPTETHVVTSFTHRGDPREWPTLSPIGTPLPHVRIRIVDESGRRVDLGNIGEIYVAGDCLARGYINADSLTADRFVHDAESRERMYRTGDLGRECDGLLEYHGRCDRQVKISGYRVELGEVEAALTSHPEIEDAVVVGEETIAGSQRLIAYVVAQRHMDCVIPAQVEYRDYLRGRVPAYMIPSSWVALARIPRTPNGKVDRASLSPPSRREELMLPGPRRASRTEARIATIWRRALQVSVVGLDDNFFDIGGTSLLLIYVQSVLRAELGVELPVVALFEHPTIRTLGAVVDGGTAHAEAAVDPHRLSEQGPDNVSDGVAILGIACRFPGAPNPQQFWTNLCNGVESLEHGAPPEGRAAGFVAAAGVLPDVEWFDADLFGFTRRDAEWLDPQHRLFLECAWEALEDAGIEPRRLGGRIGVFGGCGPSTYLLNHLHAGVGWRPDRNLIDSTADLQLLVSTDKDFLTSRVSYKLDLRGPSVNVNTACATSLVALHYACRALLAGECDAALAGAANVPIPQLEGYIYEAGMVFSRDGRCRAFDEAASGTVFSSGVGVVALKRLSDAIRDGDDIYAVVRGTAVNNDGGLKAGLTAPSVDGQARATREAMMSGRVDPRTVSYVETHGTGTPLGDPIEVAALRRVFEGARPGSCVLGAVKTNIGHLGWAAGMAGLIKAALAVRHGIIPPTLHFRRPNPELRIEGSPFRVSTELSAWHPDGPRRAGVSAFGLGGTNAHAVLEEAPRRLAAKPSQREWFLVPLSARDEASLAEMAIRLADAACLDQDSTLADVVWTLSVCRKHHSVRRVYVIRTLEDLRKRLSNPVHVETTTAGLPGGVDSGRIVGLFTGQGAEYVGMGRRLYRAEPVFRRVLDSADEILRATAGFSLLETLVDDDAGALTRISEIQPAVFAVQVALTELWRSWGVEFDAVIGHSLGEFAAACTAGVFSFEDGLRFVAERGRLLQALSDDAAMAAVFADEGVVATTLRELYSPVAIAAVNSPVNTVVSGTRAAVRSVCAAFQARSVETRELKVSRAGHSSLMDPILDEFEAVAAGIVLQPPRIDLISNTTGRVAAATAATPQYWRRHLRETVRFADGLRTIAAVGAGAFIELGGTPVLLAMAQAVLPDHPGPWVASLRPGEDDERVLAEAAGALYIGGFDLDWASIQKCEGRPTHLPTYPFQRKRFWVDAPSETSTRVRRPSPKRQGPADPREWGYAVEWRRSQCGGVQAWNPRAGQPLRKWLILADTAGIGQALAVEIERRGGQATLVLSGDRSQPRPECSPTVDLTCPGSGRQVLHDARACNVDTIVHLCGLDARLSDGRGDPDGAGVIDSLRRPLGSALGVAQLVAEWTGTPRPRLCIVTQGAQRVLADDVVVHPAQATLWGLSRVGELEHPDIDWLRIDLAANEPVDFAQLIDVTVSDELEPEVALRNQAWYVPRLVRVPLHETVPQIAADGTYLITGGLGGLGLWSAKELVKHGARRLVLVGRSQPSASASEAVSALRAAGVMVSVIHMDVSRRARVRELLDELDGSGSVLRGIIHCAGIIDDGVVTSLSWDRVAGVLAPKAEGAWNLHVETCEREVRLDFFVLYSSATSILGNAGQASHAAACAFLDALAHLRQTDGQPATSLNWGAWVDVGYLAARPELATRLQSSGMGWISEREGGLLFASAFASRDPQLAFLPNEWDIYLSGTRRHDAFWSQLAVGRSTDELNATLAQQIAEAPPEARRKRLLSYIYDAVSRLLGGVPGKGLDVARKLSEYGVDSLAAIQLRNAIQRDLRVVLPPRVVFEHPTIGELVNQLSSTDLTEAWRSSVTSRSPSTFVSAGALGTSGTVARQANGHSIVVSSQQRRWLRLIRDVKYGQRVVPIVFSGALDRQALAAALRLVVERHDLLRYRYPDGRVEVLSADEVLPIGEALFADLTHLDPKARRLAVQDRVRRCTESLPDPAYQVPWTVICLELSREHFALLLGLQHLEFDGTSLSVFVNELSEAYRALVRGATPAFEPVTHYREYAAAQAEYVRTELAPDRAFFEGLFGNLETTTIMPGHPGFARTVALESERFTPTTPVAAWADVSAAAENLGTSPFAILLASYARLVAEITGTSQVVIGIVTSDRMDSRFDRTIGPFTSPFPVPIVIEPSRPDQLVRRCDRLVGQFTARARYPVADLVEIVPAFHGFPEDSYFTDTCINFLNYRKARASESPVEILEVLGPVKHPDFTECTFGNLRRIPGLHLVADVNGGALRANYWHHVDRFSVQEVAEWAERHRAILGDSIRLIGTTGR